MFHTADGRITTHPKYIIRYGEDWVRKSAGEFSRYARAAGFEPAALAAAWVASHPAVTAPIIGARNVEQLDSTLKALDIEMTPTMRAEISALSPEPPPVHDRNDERE
jgi:aryl-alcohol dehydrogenase-like predicted oxidoreductase